MGYDCVKGGKEYLRLGECGLRGMSGELKESQTTSKNGKQIKSFRGSLCVCGLRCLCFYNGVLGKH